MTVVPAPPAPPAAGRRPEAGARAGLYALLAANAAAVAVLFVRAGSDADALLSSYSAASPACTPPC